MYHRDDQFDSYAHTSSTWVKIGDFHVDFTISECCEIKKSLILLNEEPSFQKRVTVSVKMNRVLALQNFDVCFHYLFSLHEKNRHRLIISHPWRVAVWWF